MHFFQSSVRHKLIALLLISTVVPIVSSIVITYIYTNESIKDRTIQENTRLLSEGKRNIANYLETVNNASLILYSIPAMDRILSKGVSDNQDESYIYTAMQLVSRAANDIYQVYLYLSQDGQSYLMYDGGFTSKQITPPPAMNRVIPPNAALMEPTHPSNNYGVQKLTPSKPDPVFTFHRPLYRIPTPAQIGLLSIDIKLGAIKNLSDQLFEKGSEDFYIIDSSGAVIYASDESLVGQTLHKSWTEPILQTTNAVGNLEWNKSDFRGILLYSKLSYPFLEWTLVKGIPDNYLYKHTRNLTMINTVVAVLFLTLAMAAVLYVSILFTIPIKKLIRSMNKIQAGQLEEPIDISRNDEFGLLAKRFRTMMQTINDLILQEYKLKLANKTNQLKMLQAQINPHFINNALQSIGASALDHDADEVYGLVSSLGKMMHYSMNMKETVVPLSQELEYVSHYLLLQQQRFEEELKIEYALDERAGPVPIPKMIVQPLVENYFKHGFHKSSHIGILKISTKLHNDMLHIGIEDNGIGISEERLAAIRHELSDPHPESSDRGDRIGLINVMFRLRLYYGEQAILNLEETQPQGLKITMSVPVLQGGKP
ncbi:sensor histidine kinase [Paenibacillus sp. GCM10027628]|uniref:cache domain-containing sensor histidine kinase n=1 Tax=Paenibacillus sp. GCM10027628 TaxID=3273413 RepID=UPI0036412FE0